MPATRYAPAALERTRRGSRARRSRPDSPRRGIAAAASAARRPRPSRSGACVFFVALYAVVSRVEFEVGIGVRGPDAARPRPDAVRAAARARPGGGRGRARPPDARRAAVRRSATRRARSRPSSPARPTRSGRCSSSRSRTDCRCAGARGRSTSPRSRAQFARDFGERRARCRRQPASPCARSLGSSGSPTPSTRRSPRSGCVLAFATRAARRSSSLLVLPLVGAAPLLRARAPAAHRQRARAERRIPRHRVPARRRRRGGRRVHRQPQPPRRRPRARRRRRARAVDAPTGATPSSSRCCTTSARSASPPRSSTSPARSTPTSAR